MQVEGVNWGEKMGHLHALNNEDKFKKIKFRFPKTKKIKKRLIQLTTLHCNLKCLAKENIMKMKRHAQT